MSLLEVDSAGKSYDGVPAVTDVSFAVEPGETLAVIGPNGAGKSTLFGVVAGEHQVTSGRVRFQGVDVTRWRANRLARAGMSRTFQVARLFGSRTVEENVSLAIAAKNGWYRSMFDSFDRTVRRNRVQLDDALDRLRLSALRDRRAADLSQGDRKRLELAMAVAQEPVMLLLDEPTAGMSNEDCDITVELLHEIKRHDDQLAVVMTGHDMQVLLAVATRVMLMAEGRTVLDADPETVRTSPQARELYLGENA
ncbi:ABC transporter ATP-binding protein [Microbacterium pseudoresistens]|uniref:Branched-chain amino acid transport system ATP-binding protein n=1 Tax=Microbacterium pseudoresistens TaxID=640634 RepID=A0A7Y9JLZ8_9MICO|nr:ABC transporter ATP-binding protein [Microbacterium pseudoresistens]NYD54262.1 branched-chain amino acid transport system ATP-binding protein [Microbacterium pseudoresistens]